MLRNSYFQKLEDDCKVIAYFYFVLDRSEIKFRIEGIDSFLENFNRVKTDNLNNCQVYIVVDEWIL